MRAAAAVAGALVVALLAAFLVQRGQESSWAEWANEADSVLGPKKRVQKNYSTYRGPRPKSQTKIVELNGADSMELVGVYGIGPVFAGRILAYRAALGGFYRVEQLTEVRGITEEVFWRVAKNFRVDEARIRKININFVAPNVLEKHPYVTPNLARRLVEGRTKGGYYTSTEELLDRDIVLPGEAKRLAPYLSFTQTE